ncbi:MAG: MTH938/NDUFAF3 family protein [Pseudomonadota bacterium]
MSRIVPVMKLNEDANRSVNLIRGYAADEIIVGGQHLQRPCVVAAQTLITDWAPAGLEALALEDLDSIWALAPQVVLLGTGLRQRFASATVRREFQRRNVALEAMDLGAACRTYNVLVQEDRAVVAALFTERLAAGRLPGESQSQ